jgi:hypothetical protein
LAERQGLFGLDEVLLNSSSTIVDILVSFRQKEFLLLRIPPPSGTTYFLGGGFAASTGLPLGLLGGLTWGDLHGDRAGERVGELLTDFVACDRSH